MKYLLNDITKAFFWELIERYDADNVLCGALSNCIQNRADDADFAVLRSYEFSANTIDEDDRLKLVKYMSWYFDCVIDCEVDEAYRQSPEGIAMEEEFWDKIDRFI